MLLDVFRLGSTLHERFPKARISLLPIPVRGGFLEAAQKFIWSLQEVDDFKSLPSSMMGPAVTTYDGVNHTSLGERILEFLSTLP